MTTCSAQASLRPFTRWPHGKGPLRLQALHPLTLRPTNPPQHALGRRVHLACARASAALPGEWPRGEAPRIQGTEIHSQHCSEARPALPRQADRDVNVQPRHKMLQLAQSLQAQCNRLWPILRKVLPRLVVTAAILGSPWLLRPSHSLAHGGASAAGHLHGLDSSSAAEEASRWAQCASAGSKALHRQPKLPKGAGHVVRCWACAIGAGFCHQWQGAGACVGPWDAAVQLLQCRYGWTGLVAGGLHTLTGPDHLAALAPLTIGRSRVESAAIGALWGLGHDAGQILFGILFLLLKEKLHLDSLRVWGSRVVALTLMGIGAMGIHEARMAEIEGLGHHDHSHSHSHTHDHSTPAGAEPLTPSLAGASGSASAAAATPVNQRKTTFSVATFVTGIVHGLQPDALLVVLPALAMPSRIAGASFLSMFLLGTVIAMGSYTAFIGSCSDALRDRVPGITKKLSWAAAFLALALGAGMMLGEIFGFSIL